MAETDGRPKGEGSARDHRPKLTIVIGANGAGKSTWYREHESELPKDFYDADSIANTLGDWDDPHDQIQAARRVNRAIRGHLDIHAVFVGTRDPRINVARVRRRVVENTGHDVDADHIRRRWSNAQENLAKTVLAFSRIDLYDNSGTTYRRIAVVRQYGIERVSPEAPEWARKLLARLQRPR